MAQAEDLRPARRTGRVWTAPDLVGLGVLLAGLGWSQLTTVVADSDGGAHVAGFFLAIGAAYAAARLLSRVDSAAVPLAIVVIGAALIVLAGADRIYTDAPRVGPFGYSSVTGAFYLQCAVAGGVLLFDRRLAVRVIGAVAALAFLAVPVATQTRAAIGGMLLLPVIWLVKRLVGTRAAIVSAGVLAVTALLVTMTLAATYSGADAYDPDAPRSGIDRMIDATLSLRRIEFQHDALRLMLDEPLVGVGPGRFDEVSDAVARDPDEPWAHNDFLQHGAESGLLGFALVTALFAWLFVRLAGSIGRRRRSVLVAFALTALVVHASLEYVLQRAAVPAVAAALVGCAVGLRPARGRPAREAAL